MRRIKFIARLAREQKIRLVEPTADVAVSYRAKSRNALAAADLLLAQGLLEEATSMAYYAMYHQATALFYLVGVKCENHAATIVLLKELFGIDNESISFAKRERVDKQYYADFHITKHEVLELRSIAQEFIGIVDLFSDKLTNEQKRIFRSSFQETYLS